LVEIDIGFGVAAGDIGWLWGLGAGHWLAAFNARMSLGKVVFEKKLLPVDAVAGK